ncbi:MAG: flagellar basal body rod protein FlgC [Armatimonadota bacterium]
MANSMDISASGLSAQRTRLDLIAENLANAETTRTPEGTPYKRRQAVFSLKPEEGGVEVSGIVEDARAPRLVYEPGHPDANAEGYVQFPNVNAVEEMIDLVSATRAYEANVTALNASKSMTRKALEIGR